MRNPLRTSSSASLAVDFDVQRSNDIGVPRVSGCTNSSSASSSPGWVSINGFGPAPGARTRSNGPAPAATSRIPVITVLRLNPDASVTRAWPPRPSICAAAPASRRRCRSSSSGDITPKNRSSNSGVTSTPLDSTTRD